MAHGRTGPDIVLTIRYAGKREIDAVSRHEVERTEDGASAIDPARSHLNEILHGPATQSAAVKAMTDAGVRPPTAQADAPFVQIVLSASPTFFRDQLDEPGTWNAEKLEAWKSETMAWLRSEYGEDLAHASLHLDEDTPHIHVLVVPTYSRKPRKPGRKKRNETDEEFEARKAAAENGTAIRTMSRSSSLYWKRMWCRREARKSYHAAVEHLGLGYGKDFMADAEPSPDRKDTGKWVREQATELRAREKKLNAREVYLDQRDAALTDRETQIQRTETKLRALSRAVQQLIGTTADILGVGNTLREIREKIRQVLPENDPVDPFSAHENLTEESEGPGF